MIKRILIVIFVLFLFGIPVCAEGYQGNSESADDIYDYENYLPNMIKEILNQNSEHDGTEMTIGNIYQTLLSYINLSIDKYSELFINLLMIIVLISVSRVINDNNSSILSLNLVFGFAICQILFTGFISVNTGTLSFLSSVKEFLSVILPSFSAVNVLGGSTALSASGGYSFAAVISLLDLFLCGVIAPLCVIMLVLGLFEKISLILANFNTVKNIRKYTIMLISFITVMMLTVISFQSILSAKADSASVKTVKFAASGFIPIVGSAIGEALRTVGSGISYIKASVGASSAIALFFTVAPFLCELITLKFLLRFISFFSSVCGCENETGFLTVFIDILDVLLSIIICVAVLSFLLIYLFFITSFGGVQYG